jgi:hypothetical protein
VFFTFFGPSIFFVVLAWWGVVCHGAFLPRFISM